MTAHLAAAGTDNDEYGACLLVDAALVRAVSAEIGQAAAELVARPLDPVAAAHMRRALGARAALARASLRRLQREPRGDVHEAPARPATHLAVVRHRPARSPGAPAAGHGRRGEESA